MIGFFALIGFCSVIFFIYVFIEIEKEERKPTKEEEIYKSVFLSSYDSKLIKRMERNVKRMERNINRIKTKEFVEVLQRNNRNIEHAIDKPTPHRIEYLKYLYMNDCLTEEQEKQIVHLAVAWRLQGYKKVVKKDGR